MKRRMVALSAALGSALASTVAAGAQTPAVSIETLRAQHAAHTDAIASLEVIETVQAFYLGYEDHQRRTYEFVFSAEEVDERMRAWEAKKQRVVRQRSTYDFVADSVRVEQTDLSDLDDLADRFGVRKTGALLMSLDQTRTEIRTPARTLHVNETETTVMPASPEYLLRQRIECMGIIAPNLIDGRYAVEFASDTDGHTQVRGHYPDSDQLAFEITLEPGPGLYVQHEVRYSPDGQRVAEFSASDYRTVARGVRVPMHTESTRIHKDGREHTEIRDVESVRVNPEVPEAIFQAPPDKRVADMRSTLPGRE